MTKTLTQMRQAVAKELAPLPFIAATSDGSASTTTLIDLDELGKFADNKLRGAWLYDASRTPTDFQIVSNVQSTGVATFRPTINAAPDTEAYELLPFASATILNALNEAIEHAHEEGWISRPLTLHAVTGSPIYNAFNDYWTSSSALDGWTAASVTIARERRVTDTKLAPLGDHNIVFSAGAGTLTLNAEYRHFLEPLRNTSVRLHALCSATEASELRAQILVEGVVVGSTDFHTGDDQFQVVSSSDITIAEGATNITVRWDVAAVSGTNVGAAIWFDSPVHIESYPFPTLYVPDGPEAIYRRALWWNDSADTFTLGRQRPVIGWDIYRNQDASAAGEQGRLDFEGRVPHDGQLLQMPCTAALTQAALDADVIEVVDADVPLLAKMAAQVLLRRAAMNAVNNRVIASRLETLSLEIDGYTRKRTSGARDYAPLGPAW